MLDSPGTRSLLASHSAAAGGGVGCDHVTAQQQCAWRFVAATGPVGSCQNGGRLVAGPGGRPSDPSLPVTVSRCQGPSTVGVGASIIIGAALCKGLSDTSSAAWPCDQNRKQAAAAAAAACRGILQVLLITYNKAMHAPPSCTTAAAVVGKDRVLQDPLPLRRPRPV